MTLARMVLVIVSVYDVCCSSGLLIDWTLWEADSRWKIEEFFHEVSFNTEILKLKP